MKILERSGFPSFSLVYRWMGKESPVRTKVTLIMWLSVCPQMLDVNDSAKIWPLLSSSTQCPTIHITSLTFHSDDITFLTSGSGPACKTVTEEVALFVLAAHRTSGITGRWRALVWNIFKREKTKRDTEKDVFFKMSLYKQVAYINCILTPERGRASLMCCVSGVQYK